MQKTIIVFLILILIACQSQEKKYPISAYNLPYDGMLDTILPFFAKLHDSIPFAKRFSPENNGFMQVHKKERAYEWLHYTVSKDKYCYFLICRNEPSIKRDKFLSICGRFMRNAQGCIDTASYEELFWTWKMRKPELLDRSEILFDCILNKGNVEQYQPGKSADEWVEFPGNSVVYEKKSHRWIQTNGL